MNIEKSNRTSAIINLIAAILGIAVMAGGIIQDIPLLKFSGIAFTTAIFAVILTIYVIKNFFLPQGVFAVSAIIINENKKLLLIKDEKDNKLKQPGCHYKTLKFNNELEIPYSKILDNIQEETGIPKEYLKFIDLSKNGNNGNCLLGDKLIEKEKTKFIGYTNNVITPPPFFIMQEKSRPKISGAEFYIDAFYAFKTEINETELKNNGKFYSKDDIDKSIEKQEIYPDLKFVFDNFKRIYQATNFPNSNIRLCTFNTSENENILLWRVTESCNAQCNYCILGSSRQLASEPIRIEDDKIQNVINEISNKNIKKLIISGGEPLLVENLVEIVKKISSKSSCKITICTNGIKLNDDNEYDKITSKLKNIENFKKFVISVDHYDEESYIESKKIHGNNFRLSDLERIIKKLRNDGFDIFVNVMGTDYFTANPKKYVKYWREHNFNKLSISYPINCDNSNEKKPKKKSERKLEKESEKESIKYDKFKLKRVYDEIIQGEHGDVSFFDKNGLELIIPDCYYGYCPHDKIFHATPNGEISNVCPEKKGKNTKRNSRI